MIGEIIGCFLPDLEHTQAETGAEALRLAGTTQFDLLICDLERPEENALEFLRRFQQLHPATPILICSGFPSSERPEGVEGFVPKGDLLIPGLVQAIRQTLAAGRGKSV